MPTHDRRRFVPLAIDIFLYQDFPNRELVIVDDGRDSIDDLIPSHSRIHYERLEQRVPLGTKRNLACEAAHGEVIIHWDDDDWYAPDRISVQVEALRFSGADVSGLSSLLFFDPEAGAAWCYSYPERHTQRLVAGSSMCYTRTFWEHNKFESVTIGEDNYFQLRSRKVLALRKERMMVALIHRANTSPRSAHGPRWRNVPEDDIVTIMGADAHRYRAAVQDTTYAYSRPSAGLDAPVPTPSGLIGHSKIDLVRI